MSIATEANPPGAVANGQAHYAVRSYQPAAKILHWVTAVLIAFMVASGITMRQLGAGPVTDFLFTLHKTTGALIVLLVVVRFAYRILRRNPDWRPHTHRRPFIHWLLYALLIFVPLLGWAGISDYGAREIFFGLSLPSIWPEGAGWYGFLFESHAWAAFGMLAIVALHIGMAVQDHMTRSRWDAPEEED